MNVKNLPKNEKENENAQQALQKDHVAKSYEL